MTPHPLQVEIARLRRRARALGWAQGACHAASWGIAAVLLWWASDYLLRYREAGLRLLGLIAVVAIALWAMWRHVAPLLRWRFSTTDVARIVEARLAARRGPRAGRAGGDSVASAIEFLGMSSTDESAGSSALRESVIASAARAVSEVRLADVLDQRPTWRAVALVLTLVAMAASGYTASPSDASLALSRFVSPFSEQPWPSRHELAFDPVVARLARGETFDARVVARRGSLPGEVWMEYSSAAESPEIGDAEWRELMQLRGDAMFTRRERVTDSFWYRATGGDDRSMPWRRVEVVAAPDVSACEITLHPPPYTGWTVVASPKAIRALIGTRVTIAAVATRPLAEAAVVLDSERRIPLAIDSSGLRLTLASKAGDEWLIDESQAYWFELVARDGTRVSAAQVQRWDIQPIVDLPPAVAVEEPTGVLFVTPQATVNLQVNASDDLAVANVVLEAEVAPGESAKHSRTKVAPVTLYRRPSPKASLDAAQAGTSPMIQNANSLDAWTKRESAGPIDVSWPLDGLGLSPGDQIEFVVAARDLKGSEGRSPPGRINVVSREELIERIADQQSHLAEQLNRALELAQQTQRTAKALEIKSTVVKPIGAKLATVDADAWRAVESDQRQLTRILFDPSDGVAAVAERLLGDLTSNRLRLAGVNERIATTARVARRLEREMFPEIDRELAAVWNSPSGTTSRESLSTAFHAVVERMESLSASLAALRDGLARWDNARRVSREIGELRRIEQALQSRVIELSRSTIGRAFDELSADERAEIAQLTSTQRELATRLDRTQLRVERLVETLSAERQAKPSAARPTAGVGGDASDADAEDLLADGLDFLRERSIAVDIAAAADRILANQLGQANAMQTTVIAAFDELLALLDNRPETDPQRLAARLDAAIRKVAAERQRFDAVADFAERQRDAAAVRTRVSDASRGVKRLAREAVRIDAIAAAKRLAIAAARIDDVPNALAGERSTWPATRATIDADFAAAATLLVAQRRQAEADALRRELTALAERVMQLAERQEAAIRDAEKLQSTPPDVPPEFWRATAADITSRQERMAQVAVELATAARADAFVTALRMAGDEMRRAVAALAERTQLAEAIEFQRLALERLRQVAQATKPVEPSPQDNQPPTPGDTPPAPAESGAIHIVEELRMIKLLQDAVNARARRLHQERGAGDVPLPPSAAQRRRYDELAAEQSRIVKLFTAIFQGAAPGAQGAVEPEPVEVPAKPPENAKPPIDDGPSPIGP